MSGHALTGTGSQTGRWKGNEVSHGDSHAVKESGRQAVRYREEQSGRQAVR